MRGYAVRVYPERGTTHTIVKVPKYCLSANESVFMARDSEEVGLEAATL